MDKKISEQIIFVLEDDNEVMTTALEPGCDLDEENKQMNRELIKKHEAIIARVEKGGKLTQENLLLIRDANEIHLNDEVNINGHHKQAVRLNDWLDKMIELTKEQAMEILEKHLDRDSHTPAKVYRALHTLWEETTPDEVVDGSLFDDEGRCLKCGSKVSFADTVDTVVFVGEEIVKTYPGDITNMNCVKCNYPERYPDYEHYD
jgi:hypothetical protein